MEFGVLLFNHGTAHCARLVVAIHSLRKHYGGPVTILDTGRSGGIVEKIAADKRLEVEARQIPFVERRRNSCYCMKASLWRDSPYDATLFLDADTLVARSIEPLIEIVCSELSPGFVATRFSDWLTTGEMIRGRIEKWHGVKVEADGDEKPIDVRELIRLSLESPWPAINTGVIGWRDDARKTLRAWERITHAGWRCPFTDELAAQLLVRKWPYVLVADRFNCSPIYGRDKDSAVIWHAHGRKALTRPDGRGAEAHKIWEPVFREVFAGDVGGIREWAPAGDETLAHNMGLFAA